MARTAPPLPWRLPDQVIAAAIVAVLAAILAILGEAWAVKVERGSAEIMAPELLHQRDAGVALARADFSQGNILPVYGSSELERDMPNRASDFFRDAPDGFRVCPMGRAGTASLLLLEKAAATGEAGAGAKAVVLVSQFWFLTSDPKHNAYFGNFSALQGMELIFKAPLSPRLRRDIARRMLDIPYALARLPLLRGGALAAAGTDTPAGKLSYGLLLPLGLMETWVMEMQDHFESVREVLAARPARLPAPTPATMDWDRLITDADSASPSPREAASTGSNTEDLATTWRGVNAMPTSAEWRDLELLLRTFRDLRVSLVLLDIPWSGPYYDEKGVTAGIRWKYYSRLQSLADKYQVPVDTFQDHEYDANFLHDHRSHLNPKGWVYFNRDMDAFWRGAPLPEG